MLAHYALWCTRETLLTKIAAICLANTKKGGYWSISRINKNSCHRIKGPIRTWLERWLKILTRIAWGIPSTSANDQEIRVGFGTEIHDFITRILILRCNRFVRSLFRISVLIKGSSKSSIRREWSWAFWYKLSTTITVPVIVRILSNQLHCRRCILLS